MFVGKCVIRCVCSVCVCVCVYACVRVWCMRVWCVCVCMRVRVLVCVQMLCTTCPLHDHSLATKEGGLIAGCSIQPIF